MSIIAFEAECVAALAEEEPTLLQSAVNLIAGANASPPPAPPVQEPNFLAGGIFLGVLGFCCVSGILYVGISCSNFRAEEDKKKRQGRA